MDLIISWLSWTWLTSSFGINWSTSELHVMWKCRPPPYSPPSPQKERRKEKKGTNPNLKCTNFVDFEVGMETDNLSLDDFFFPFVNLKAHVLMFTPSHKWVNLCFSPSSSLLWLGDYCKLSNLHRINAVATCIKSLFTFFLLSYFVLNINAPLCVRISSWFTLSEVLCL